MIYNGRLGIVFSSFFLFLLFFSSSTHFSPPLPPLHLHSKWKPVMPLTVSNAFPRHTSDCYLSLRLIHTESKKHRAERDHLIDLGDQSKRSSLATTGFSSRLHSSFSILIGAKLFKTRCAQCHTVEAVSCAVPVCAKSSSLTKKRERSAICGRFAVCGFRHNRSTSFSSRVCS
jgi:hypothetical protein